jgi:hypothetical protein
MWKAKDLTKGATFFIYSRQYRVEDIKWMPVGKVFVEGREWHKDGTWAKRHSVFIFWEDDELISDDFKSHQQ